MFRRAQTKAWKDRPAKFIYDVALSLSKQRSLRWVGYEFIRYHAEAFNAFDDRKLSQFSIGLDSWDSVDAFARILSGPAWAQGKVSDKAIMSWTQANDRWLRRAALVSTVALNRLSDGGRGDTVRTLRICRRLATDRDDMVEKALSWALRALCAQDAAAVRAFLAAFDGQLAARIKREVGNKLRTGLKNPRRP